MRSLIAECHNQLFPSNIGTKVSLVTTGDFRFGWKEHLALLDLKQMVLGYAFPHYGVS